MTKEMTMFGSINEQESSEINKFEECMSDAKKLYRGPFAPEIDNLATQTIDSILYKVLIEQDLLQEGQLDVSVDDTSAQQWLKDVSTFFRKWRGYVSEDDRGLYARH